MTDFIKVENLVFDYIKSEDESTFRAIDDVSFTVEKGSFTAIIGQNGSCSFFSVPITLHNRGTPHQKLASIPKLYFNVVKFGTNG